jgi:hypothetical protein
MSLLSHIRLELDVRATEKQSQLDSATENQSQLVNGWAVSLNRTPNVTMLQTYTPAAELTDTGDFVSVCRSHISLSIFDKSRN